MPRPVTLFTGQWADLPLEKWLRKPANGASMGWNWPAGATTSRWTRRSEKDSYVTRQSGSAREVRPEGAGPSAPTWSASACAIDPIDERHKSILPSRIWGDGDPKACASGRPRRSRTRPAPPPSSASRWSTASPARRSGTCWPSSRPCPLDMIEAGYKDFADRWNPILDVFDEVGVKFALEVHPSEIAYDFWTTHACPGCRQPPPGLRHQLRPEPSLLADDRSGRTSSTSSPTASTTCTSRSRSAC